MIINEHKWLMDRFNWNVFFRKQNTHNYDNVRSGSGFSLKNDERSETLR